jgi:hypothetical protein
VLQKHLSAVIFDANLKRNISMDSQPYHLQIVLTLEYPPTGFAVVLIVILVTHVLIGCLLCMELSVASFAWYLRHPMAHRIHMLTRRRLRAKLPCAGLAADAWCPVLGVIHVLIASALCTKDSGAGLAFWPVAIVIHMVVAVVFVPEGLRARLTLVHIGQDGAVVVAFKRWEGWVAAMASACNGRQGEKGKDGNASPADQRSRPTIKHWQSEK